MAMELMNDAPLLFLDEPTSGLDARAAAIVMRGMRKAAATGRGPRAAERCCPSRPPRWRRETPEATESAPRSRQGAAAEGRASELEGQVAQLHLFGIFF